MSKNIYLLPTDKPSRLYQKDSKYKLDTSAAIDWYISSVGFKPVNLYITSDETPKIGNFALCSNSNIKKVTKDKIDDRFVENWVKIILTTDRDLIKDGVQAIDDEFLEWFVKNPNCEYVDVKNYKFSEYPLDYKIIIPKEEPKQEPFEEAAERLYLDGCDGTNRSAEIYRRIFIEGAKWQAERSYREEDMRKCWEAACAFTVGSFKYFKQIHPNFEEWFEQYKKKV